MKQHTQFLKDLIEFSTKLIRPSFPVYHHKKLFLPNLVLVLCTCFLQAQNPLITHMYTADPTARVFDGKLYIYPSSDTVPPADYTRYQHCMPGYNIFSLENGASWKDHGRFLNNDEVPWALKGSYSMWAPDCIEKDGKYYFYFPVRAADSVHRVGVAIGSSPTGPFKVEKDYIPGTKGIDPGLLKDDDGTFYMFFGSGHEIHVAPLKKNMKELAQEPISVQGLPGGYMEGAFPFKKDGIYYLSFAHIFRDEGYTIGYATSDKPMGPYRYRGKIIDNIGSGTNHHSVVEYQGDWILFYHQWEVSGDNKLRSIRADYMYFDKPRRRILPGAIKKVIPTLRGIGAPTLGDTLQVDRYNEIKGAKTAFVGGGEPNGWMICETEGDAYVRFNRVDFGDGTAEKLTARISGVTTAGTLDIYLDDIAGKKIATLRSQNTGGWNSWKTVETELLEKVEGVHDLFLLFTSRHGTTKIMNVNWLIIH